MAALKKHYLGIAIVGIVAYLAYWHFKKKPVSM